MKYSFLTRLTHWCMFILISGITAVGFCMTSLPPDDADKYVFYGYHKEFGVLLALLLIFRIVTRLISKAPRLPHVISKQERTFSGIVILSLYLLMAIVPLSGFLMSSMGGHPIIFFGHTLPSPFGVDAELAKVFYNMHGPLAFALITVIFLHVLGWMKHYIFDKINLLNRIW